MNKVNEFISIKIVSYAMCDFLYALLDNGVSESDICVSKEDDNLIVRIPKDSLYNARYKKYNKTNCLEGEENGQIK